MRTYARVIAMWLVVTAISFADHAEAQHIFADVDGDGAATAADRLSHIGQTSIDIWLQSDRDRDGRAAAPVFDSAPLSVLSYEFVLRAVDGTVDWISYTNRQAGMAVPFRNMMSPSEFYIGFGGTEALPPGRVRLGTLVVRVATGSPHLEFAPRSMIKAGGRTSFGSKNRGNDDDNTIKLATSPTISRSTGMDGAGGWTDASGVGSPDRGEPERVDLKAGGATIAFSATVARGAGRGKCRLTIATTRSGFLKVHLFDPQGRLVRTIAESIEVEAGLHAFAIDRRGGPGARLARGIYLYRVEAPEGILSGKIAVVD